MNQTHKTAGQVATAFFEANDRGDAAAVRELFAPDATFVIPGDPALVPWVGSRDRDGIADYMTAFAANADLDRIEIDTMMVDGEDVVVLGRFALRFPSGGRLDDPFAIHLVVRDGLIRSYLMHEDSLNLAREVTGQTAPGTLPATDSVEADSRTDLLAITETAMTAARAVAGGDVDGVLSMFDEAPATFLFDYSPPRSISTAELRERFGAAATTASGSMRFDVLEFHPEMLGPDTAWSWQISRYRTVDDADGGIDLTWRVTDIWRRIDGRWRAVHEHGSFPVDLATGTADLTST